MDWNTSSVMMSLKNLFNNITGHHLDRQLKNKKLLLNVPKYMTEQFLNALMRP